ncbi:hypothetical protein FACS1894110_15360 [Spirochaetia bacterium]|nr:hypothetical protein FACS1894110_15360 [Spirochaetia bacterium]
MSREDIEEMLNNPPKGAWYKEDFNTIKIGISATVVYNAGLVLFSFFWIWAIIEVFRAVPQSDTPLAFIIVGIIMATPFIPVFLIPTIMGIIGKNEIVIDKNGKGGYVFKGIGKMGIKYEFDWESIKNIHYIIGIRTDGESTIVEPSLFIEGKKTIKFGTGINEEKKDFLFRVFSYYLSEYNGSKNYCT